MENVKEIFPELYKLSKSQTVRIYASNMTYPPSVAGLRHLNLCPFAQMFWGEGGETSAVVFLLQRLKS